MKYKRACVCARATHPAVMLRLSAQTEALQLAASAPNSSLLHDITHQPPDWLALMLGCDWSSTKGGGYV